MTTSPTGIAARIETLEQRITELEAEQDRLRYHLRVVLTYLHPFPHSETSGPRQPPTPDPRLHELIMGPLEELGGRVPFEDKAK